ncbi:MAG: TrmB family transcriptional regulator [Gemmatimonadetes bacterium]|nr:TrmB family transcriptional regulator [Gemmatimonadota bacterium]
MPSEKRVEPPALERFVEDLQLLGFTEHEARAYIALLESHPATAYEVSKLSGLPRANAYSAVGSLAKKRAVQPVSRRPVRYVPIDPEFLFGRIAGETSARCNDLAEKLSSLKKSDTTEYVWVVSGESNIESKMGDMIRSARRHIWVRTDAHLLEPYRAHLREAADRGVEILIILFGDDAAAQRFRLGRTVRVYLHEASGMVVALGMHLIMLTRDFEETLVANTADGGYGAHTRSRPIVEVTDSLIRHEVYLAEIFQRFGPEIERAFGPALLSLRQKYLPEEQIQALRKRLGLGVAGRISGKQRARGSP